MATRRMFQPLLALAVAITLSGCFTTIGASLGAVTARNMNRSAAAATSGGSHHSVVGWTFAGLGAGLILDALLLEATIDSSDRREVVF